MHFIKLNFNYYSIMSGNSIFITGTLLQEPGKLVRKNNRVSHFFDYKENDFEMITNVSQLLPYS